MKLTPEIRQLQKLHEEINSSAKNILAKCFKAGELLTKIKASVKHGDWKEVLQAVQMSYNTADRYMDLWARRSELNLREVKTLADAIKLLNDAPAKISTIEITTSQNEPLTHEKTSISETQKRPNLGADSDGISRARAVTRGEDQKAQARPSASDADPVSRDSSRANVSGNGVPHGTKVITDKIGIPIPDKILPLWNRRQEVQDCLTMISRLRGMFERAQREDDPLWKSGSLNDSLTRLDQVFANVKNALPEYVCPQCQGQLNENCAFCYHNGFISQFRYNVVLPEVRAMQEKRGGARAYA